MKQLGVVTVSLCVALAVLCSAAIVRRRMLMEPDQLQKLGLGSCQGVPCFYGLMPGKTSWIETQNSIVKRFNVNAYDPCFGFGTDDLQSEVCSYAADDKLLGAIELIPTPGQIPGQISLGALVKQYGSPCLIYTYDDSAWIVVNFPQLSVSFVSNDGYLELDTNIPHLDLFAPQLTDTCAPETRSNSKLWRWRGFTRYFSRKP
jgi:hypothetical protein